MQALGISNAFLMNLSVSDFVVGVWNMPITVISVAANKWLLGNALCNFSGEIQYNDITFTYFFVYMSFIAAFCHSAFIFNYLYKIQIICEI